MLFIPYPDMFFTTLKHTYTNAEDFYDAVYGTNPEFFYSEIYGPDTFPLGYSDLNFKVNTNGSIMINLWGFFFISLSKHKLTYLDLVICKVWIDRFSINIF